MLKREPTEQEFLDYLKAGEEAKKEAPMLKGPEQPKHIEHEVSYVGMPMAKARAKVVQLCPDDAGGRNPDPDSIKAGRSPMADGEGVGSSSSAAAVGGSSSSAAAVGGSSSLDVAVAEVDPDDIPKQPLTCLNANECGAPNLRWSEFLLVNPEASWAGQIWGWCRPCSGLNPGEFKRQARSMKMQRVALKKKDLQTIRSITFRNHFDYMA